MSWARNPAGTFDRRGPAQTIATLIPTVVRAKGSLCEPGGGRPDEGNRRQYRRGGVVLRQAVFTGSCGDSTRAGRFRGASQLGPIHRRHATCRSPCGPVVTIAVWTPPSGRRGYRESRGVGQLGVLQRIQRAGGHGPQDGPERRAHPRVRTPGPLEAGRRHGRPLHPRRICWLGTAVPVTAGS